jgi:hypothetical protein
MIAPSFRGDVAASPESMFADTGEKWIPDSRASLGFRNDERACVPPDAPLPGD